MAGRMEGRMPPGASREGRQKGVVTFLRHKIYKKFCMLCWGRDGHGRTNHVRRTMLILDVISSVSGSYIHRSSKCTKIVGSWGFAPDPTAGAHSSPQVPQLGLRVPSSKAPTSKGREEQGRRGDAKMIYAPGARNLRAATARVKWNTGMKRYRTDQFIQGTKLMWNLI